jgi:hypothetical protein
MPYTHYTTGERNALQAMEGMGLPKSDMAIILGCNAAPKIGKLCMKNWNSTRQISHLKSEFPRLL